MQTVSSEFLNAFNQNTMVVKPQITIEFGNNRFNGNQQAIGSTVKEISLNIRGNIGRHVTASHDVNYCLTTVPTYTAIPPPMGPDGDPAGFLIEQTINWWSPDEAFNNKNRNNMMWGVCDRGARTDAGYRALPILDAKQYFDPTEVPIPVYEHGWWSSTKSDGSGNFGSPETLRCYFDNNRNINQIDIYFFEGYANMKTVTFGYFDDLGNQITVQSNYSISAGTYQYSFPLGSTILVSGLWISFYATQNANDYARLSEMQGLYVVDISQDVVSFQLNQNREKYQGTSPAPNVVSATFDLTLDNTTAQYSPSNPLSTNYPYVEHENKITAGINVETTSGLEYLQLGIFYADEWSTDSTQATAEAQCRDYSKYLQDEAVGYSKYWVNSTPQRIIPDLIARTGLSSDQIVVDSNATDIFGLTYVHADSFWNFLGQLAQASEARFGFDHLGKFHWYARAFQYNAPYNSPVFTFDWDNNIIGGKESTQLYLNSIIVNVNGITIFDRQVQKVWTPPADATQDSTIILSWATLANAMGTDDTELTTVENLDNPAANLMPLSGYIAIESELLSYDSRIGQTLMGLTRGVGGTIAAAHGQAAYIGEARYYPQQQFSIFPVLNINPILSFRQYPNAVQSEIDTLIALGRFNEAQQVMVNFDTSFNLALPSSDAPLTGNGLLPTATLGPPYSSTHIGDPDWPYSTAIYGPQILDVGKVSQARIMVWINDAFNMTVAIQNTVPYYTPLTGSGFPSFYDNTTTYAWDTFVAGQTPIQGAQRIRLNKKPVANLNNLRLVRKHGKTQIEISNPWIQTLNQAKTISDYISNEYNQPRAVINVDAVAQPALELGDQVTISNFPELGITNTNYYIINIAYTYDGSLQANYTLKEVNSFA